MSFILDALRKSDARRKQGEVPDIHSPQASAPQRRSRSWLALGVVAGSLVVLAAVATIVLALRGDLPGLTPGDPVPPVAVEPEPEPEPEPEETVAADDAADLPDTDELADEQETRQAERRSRRARVRPEAGTASEAESETRSETAPEVAERARDRRRPREASRDEASRDARTLREASQRRAESGRDETPAEELARHLAEAEATADTGTKEPADTRPAPEVAPEASRPAEPAREPDRPRTESRVAEYVEQWELPLSARRSLPELTLNIHVYSGRPEERFVLINGERYVEGDAIGEDVELVEIRREGAVVDFDSHRFLLRRQ